MWCSCVISAALSVIVCAAVGDVVLFMLLIISLSVECEDGKAEKVNQNGKIKCVFNFIFIVKCFVLSKCT